MKFLLVAILFLATNAFAQGPDFSSIRQVTSVWDAATVTYQDGSTEVVPARAEIHCAVSACTSYVYPPLEDETYANFSWGYVNALSGGTLWTFTITCEGASPCPTVPKQTVFNTKSSGHTPYRC